MGEVHHILRAGRSGRLHVHFFKKLHAYDRFRMPVTPHGLFNCNSSLLYPPARVLSTSKQTISKTARQGFLSGKIDGFWERIALTHRTSTSWASDDAYQQWSPTREDLNRLEWLGDSWVSVISAEIIAADPEADHLFVNNGFAHRSLFTRCHQALISEDMVSQYALDAALHQHLRASPRWRLGRRDLEDLWERIIGAYVLTHDENGLVGGRHLADILSQYTTHIKPYLQRIISALLDERRQRSGREKLGTTQKMFEEAAIEDTEELPEFDQVQMKDKKTGFLDRSGKGQVLKKTGTDKGSVKLELTFHTDNPIETSRRLPDYIENKRADTVTHRDPLFDKSHGDSVQEQRGRASTMRVDTMGVLIDEVCRGQHKDVAHADHADIINKLQGLPLVSADFHKAIFAHIDSILSLPATEEDVDVWSQGQKMARLGKTYISLFATVYLMKDFRHGLRTEKMRKTLTSNWANALLARACRLDESCFHVAGAKMADNFASDRNEVRNESFYTTRHLAYVFLKYMGGMIMSNKDESGAIAASKLRQASEWWEGMVASELMPAMSTSTVSGDNHAKADKRNLGR